MTGRARHLLLAAALFGACRASPPPVDGGLPAERSAALASLVVENRTAVPVTISFRLAIEPGREVTIGSLEPGETRELPPIPAGEPLVLTARGPDFERRLEPRSFDIEEIWTWVLRPQDDDR